MTDLYEDDIEEVQGSAPDDFVRSYEFRAEPSDDGLTLEGYAAVFNAETLIDSAREGRFYESIAKGAFKRSIGQRLPVLQFDHGQHPLIGSLPIGAIRSLKEDDHGLRVRARLFDNWIVGPVRDAIRDGAITGMSFRFQVVRDRWTGQANEKRRQLLEVAVPELGPVVFPAYAQTSVGVRSAQALDALNDPEVRSEIARILASGTDLASLAVAAPADEPRSEVNAPADEPRSDAPRGLPLSLALAQARSAGLIP
jgi:HK97 family phage prohead protease